ncbi:MAG TPA: FG-GAP-like repeat-containing protein [Coleofasciculaceae cyanobacterium]|jgi:Ca2+-binding RTX toxin-like protein
MPTPNFESPITNPFGFSQGQAYLDVALGDMDNDGDIDLFSNGLDGITRYYQNIGSATAPVFAAPVANPFGLPDIGLIATIALADLNNDGKLDVFLQSYVANGVINYFQNTGTASAPAFGAGVAIASTGDGFAATPTFGDIDNDGDLDLFSGHDDGNFRYFQNTGTASAPVFAAAVINPFGLTDAGDITKPTLGDIDNDGDLDLLVGETGSGRLNYFQNIGTASAPSFAPLVTNPFGLSSGDYPEPNLVDIDNDGDLDVLDADLDGPLRFFRNTIVAPPTALALSPNSVAENSASGTVVGNFSSTDPTVGDTFTYSLVDGGNFPDNAAFTLTGNQLKTNAVFNFEADNSYSIKVRTTDQSGLFYEGVVTVSITNINEAPTAIALSSNTVDENAVAAVIGTLTVTDPDVGDAYSFTLSDSRFEVVSGQLKLKSGVSFNYEMETSLNLGVTATDVGGLSTSNSFTINVNDLVENTAPTDLSLSTATVNENVAAGTTVGTFSTTDAEGGTFSYALASGDGSGDNGLFAIEGDQLKINASPNFEAKSSYSIRVKTTDAEGLSYEEVLTIGVNNLNEAPDAVNDSGFTANQSSPKVIASADLLANDTDPDAGTTLSITGVGNAVGGSVALSGSTVVFTPNTSFSGTASFVYTVSDGSLTDTATVTLAVGKTQNGGNGKDNLSGTAGDDILDGGNGSDTLSGGGGNDILKGGNGADILTGGSGKDQFVLAKNAGGDTITDFTDSSDVIGLSGGLTFGQLTIAANGSNTLIKLGSDTLATLTGVSSSLITSTDFVSV